jgi:hypothetical protein
MRGRDPRISDPLDSLVVGDGRVKPGHDGEKAASDELLVLTLFL